MKTLQAHNVNDSWQFGRASKGKTQQTLLRFHSISGTTSPVSSAFFFFFCLQASSNLIPSEDESRIMLLLKQVESLIFCLTDVSVLRLQNYIEQNFPIF